MPILILKGGKLTGRIGFGGSYSGEKQMGDLNDWPLINTDPNEAVDLTYGLLSARSSTLYHTYGPVRGAINKQVEYGIGPGLVFRSQPDFKTLGMTKESAVDWGKDFQRIVNYYFKEFNFYEKQGVLFRTAQTVGDSLLYFLREKGVLSDLIEASGNEIDSNYNRDNHTLGIKHDDWKRREGFRKNNGKDVLFQDSDGDQNVLQFYLKELARQLRGYPIAYSIINMARNDDTFTDAITHRAVMEAVQMAVFSGDQTDLKKQAKDLGARNSASKTGETKVSALSRMINKIRLGSGTVFEVGKDETFEFTDMKTPSNNFGEFKGWMIKYIGMATGTPPEVIMSEYSTSFTAHKGALNDFVKSYMKRRKTFERTCMDVTVREIAKDAIGQGLIKAPGFFDGGRFMQPAYLNGMYLGPVPGHINPLVEVKAETEEVKNAFDLRSNKAEKRGHDWDNVIEEWAQEQDEFTDSPQSFIDKIAKQEGLEVTDA